jgi:hypothetical protein
VARAEYSVETQVAGSVETQVAGSGVTRVARTSSVFNGATTARGFRARTSSLLCLCVAASGTACGGPPQDLSTAQLSQSVAVQQPTLKRCYDDALKKQSYDPELHMQATLHIAPDGSVTRVELAGGGGLSGMAPCIRDSIKRWRFPKARDATDTSLPLIFRRDPPKDGPNSVAAQEMLRKALGATFKKP